MFYCFLDKLIDYSLFLLCKEFFTWGKSVGLLKLSNKQGLLVYIQNKYTK